MLLIRLCLFLISIPLLAWSQADQSPDTVDTDNRYPDHKAHRRSRHRSDGHAAKWGGGGPGAHRPGGKTLHWVKPPMAAGIIANEIPSSGPNNPPSPEVKSRPCPGKSGSGQQAQPAVVAPPKQASNTAKAAALPADSPPPVVVAPARLAQPVVDVPPVQPPIVVKAKTAPVDTPPPPAPKAPAAAEPAPPPAGGSGGAGSAQADWLAAHTNARAKFGVGPVTWSAGAAAQAQANVAAHRGSCDMAHTTGGKFGENLLAGSGGSGKMAANDVVESWMSESKDFNYGDPEGKHGGKVVYHFTAIVWKTMSGIGCAIGQCGGGGTYVACCYDPFPNVMGSFGSQVPHPI